MLQAQGAELNEFNRKLARDHTAGAVVEIRAASSGFVSNCDARIIGEVVRDLGGGRITKEAEINYDVGIDKLVKPRESVSRGAVCARIHATDARQAEAVGKRIKGAFEFTAKKPKCAGLIFEIIGGE
jgi:thymidine phosphorylase